MRRSGWAANKSCNSFEILSNAGRNFGSICQHFSILFHNPSGMFEGLGGVNPASTCLSDSNWLLDELGGFCRVNKHQSKVPKEKTSTVFVWLAGADELNISGVMKARVPRPDVMSWF